MQVEQQREDAWVGIVICFSYRRLAEGRAKLAGDGERKSLAVAGGIDDPETVGADAIQVHQRSRQFSATKAAS